MAIIYTTVNKVREKLGMLSDEPIQTAKTGVTLTLQHDAYSIVYCKKNTVELTQVTSGAPGASQFLFTRPRTITLGTAAIAGDIWDIRTGIVQPDDIITDAVYDAEDEINTRLAACYTVPFATGSADIENLSIMYVKWIFADKKWTQQFPGEQSPEDKAWKRFNEVIGQIIRGERRIRDSGGTALPRSTPQDTMTVVASATPADAMTIIDNGTYTDFGSRDLIVTVDNVAHSVTGYAEIKGTNYDDEAIVDRVYYSATYGSKKSNLKFKTLTQFNALTLADGVTPLIKLEAVLYRGRVFAGVRG